MNSRQLGQCVGPAANSVRQAGQVRCALSMSFVTRAQARASSGS